MRVRGVGFQQQVEQIGSASVVQEPEMEQPTYLV
jgi:hypothetical protein